MTSLSIKQKAQQYVVLTGMALSLDLLVGAIDMIFGQGLLLIGDFRSQHWPLILFLAIGGLSSFIFINVLVARLQKEWASSLMSDTLVRRKSLGLGAFDHADDLDEPSLWWFGRSGRCSSPDRSDPFASFCPSYQDSRCFAYLSHDRDGSWFCGAFQTPPRSNLLCP